MNMCDIIPEKEEDVEHSEIEKGSAIVFKTNNIGKSINISAYIDIKKK